MDRIELTEQQWQAIQALLPYEKPHGLRRYGQREKVEACLTVLYHNMPFDRLGMLEGFPSVQVVRNFWRSLRMTDLAKTVLEIAEVETWQHRDKALPRARRPLKDMRKQCQWMVGIEWAGKQSIEWKPTGYTDIELAKFDVALAFGASDIQWRTASYEGKNGRTWHTPDKLVRLVLCEVNDNTWAWEMADGDS